MGTRGPLPKAEGRQRSNDPTGVGLVVVDGGEVEVPAPPNPPGSGRLLKVTADAWTEFWTSPVASLVIASDMPALRRLFLLYDERERAHRAYAAQRSAEGSTGQLVVNPFAKEMASIDSRLAALEDRFGLTPASRLRLGISFGEAKRSLDGVLEAAMADDDVWDDDEVDPRAS